MSPEMGGAGGGSWTPARGFWGYEIHGRSFRVRWVCRVMWSGIVGCLGGQFRGGLSGCGILVWITCVAGDLYPRRGCIGRGIGWRMFCSQYIGRRGCRRSWARKRCIVHVALWWWIWGGILSCSLNSEWVLEIEVADCRSLICWEMRVEWFASYFGHGPVFELAQLDWRPTPNMLYFKRHNYFRVRPICPIIFLNRVTFTNVVKSDWLLWNVLSGWPRVDSQRWVGTFRWWHQSKFSFLFLPRCERRRWATHWGGNTGAQFMDRNCCSLIFSRFQTDLDVTLSPPRPHLPFAIGVHSKSFLFTNTQSPVLRAQWLTPTSPFLPSTI